MEDGNSTRGPSEENLKLHDKYGVPRDLMDKVFRAYIPAASISQGCPSCDSRTSHQFMGKGIDTLSRYRGISRIETQLLELTYKCDSCHKKNIFVGVITVADRRNHGLISIVFNEPETPAKTKSGEYS